jgi:nucleoside-diphosphate-sugar epimerase
MTTCLITGAGGFVGSALARELIESLQPAGPDRLVLSDRTPRPDWCPADDPRVVWLQGDLGSADLLDMMFSERIDRVVHLAGVVSGAAEADFDLGLRVNLDATRTLLSRCADQGRRGYPPRVVYASSIAVHGVPLPCAIHDHTPVTPSLSYGVQKLINELLIAELSRRGWLDGISLRLAGVVVRPALPNGALSGFNSDLIRETLAGRRVVSPVSADAVIWLQSLSAARGALLAALSTTGAAPDGARTVQLPALAASIDEILDAVGRVTGRDARSLVDFKPDPAIEPMFGRWPRERSFARAHVMGLPADTDLFSLIESAASSALSSVT